MNKIPNDLLFGSYKEMDHPLQADVATATHAHAQGLCEQQCDPGGPTKAQTAAETKTKQWPTTR